MASFLRSYFQVFVKAKPYSLYVLLILLATFFLTQLDRFALAATSVEVAQALSFGDKSCLKLKTAKGANDTDTCNSFKSSNVTLLEEM